MTQMFSIEVWINKLQCIYIIEYYTAVYLKKLLVRAARWVNLKKHNGDQKKPNMKEIIYTDLYQISKLWDKSVVTEVKILVTLKHSD